MSSWAAHPMSIPTITLVQRLVDEDGKRNEALAERLGNGDTVQVIIFLEFLGCEVGTYQCDDIADDGCKVAPCQAFAHNEVGYSADESKMPVVPQVNVHGTSGLGDKHQQVYAQTDGDDQCTYGRVVGYGSCGRPTHVENVQLQVVEVGNGFQGIVEVGSQQGGNYTQAHETDSYAKARFQCLSKFHPDTQTNNCKDNRHHDRCSKANDIAENLFHSLLFLIMIKFMFYKNLYEISVSNLALLFIIQKRNSLIIGKKDDFIPFLSFACTKMLVSVHENQIMH